MRRTRQCYFQLGVDRWRFFTHLAQRASICIKLIGPPYWILRFAKERVRKRDAKKEKRKDSRGVRESQSCVEGFVKIFFENKDIISGVILGRWNNRKGIEPKYY